MILLAIALLLGGAAPLPSTYWMQPKALGLEVGMPKAAVVERLEKDGRKAEPGAEPTHLLVRFGDKETVTLAFEKDRLASMRFELVEFIPQVKAAFEAEAAHLAKEHGAPTKKLTKPEALIYDETTPRIYVVASIDRQTEFGRRGLGFLVVRYFAPPAAVPVD